VGDVEVGEHDQVTWSFEPCQPLKKEQPHVVVATPFELEGN
jgi:hypothetical protein